MSSFIHYIPLPRPFLSVSEPLLRVPDGEKVIVPNSRSKLLFFLSGETWLEIDGGTPTLVREGSFAVLPSPCLQTYEAAASRSTPLHAFCIRFFFPERRAKGEPPHLREMRTLAEEAFVQPVIRTDGVTPFLKQKLLLLRREMDDRQEGRIAMLYALALELWTETARCVLQSSVTPSSPGRRKARQLVNSALEYMMRHLQQTPSIEEVAWGLNISVEHLCRVFKAEKGVTPREALRNLQMHAAKNLLIHSSLEIYRIAERTGFASATSFCRYFKAHNGLTPSEYRFLKPEVLTKQSRTHHRPDTPALPA